MKQKIHSQDTNYCSNCETEATHVIPAPLVLFLCTVCATVYDWGQNWIDDKYIPLWRITVRLERYSTFLVDSEGNYTLAYNDFAEACAIADSISYREPNNKNDPVLYVVLVGKYNKYFVAYKVLDTDEVVYSSYQGKGSK